MKNAAFAAATAVVVLLLGGAAWLWRTGRAPLKATNREAAAQAEWTDGARVLDSYEVAEAFGAAYDERLGLWLHRDRMTLESGRNAPVWAIGSGRVSESVETDGGWRVCVTDDDGGVTLYGGLSAGLAGGALVEKGELVGFLKGSRLELGRKKDGVWINPEEFLLQ